MMEMLIGAVAGVALFIVLEWWLTGRRPTSTRGHHHGI